MLDIKNNHIFLHIPKTGGSSVEEAFEDCGFSKGWVRRRSHWKLSEYKELFNRDLPELREINYGDMFKWTIVRNPWDKLVSEYYYWRQCPNTCEAYGNGEMDFHRFVEIYQDVEKDIYKGISGIDPSQQGDRAHRRPQKFFMAPIYDLDYVVRFENLQEGINTVCDKIGIKRKKLPHKLKTNHKHYREYYDDDLAELVAKRFQADISLLGYSF
jgi:chondroitin 4-sulfotransferase 11